MARVLTYHPELTQLVFSPAPEYNALHTTLLAKLGRTAVRANQALSLGAWPAGAGNSSDVIVNFELPLHKCTLGVSVLQGALTVYVDFIPGSTSHVVGIKDGPPALTPAPPVGTKGNGTCGATNFGGDCNTDPSGAWDAAAAGIKTLDECVAKAKDCKMASFVSFSNVPGNTDCSWFYRCDFAHLCEDCSKCGIGCPKYYPYESEVINKQAEPMLGGSRSDELKMLTSDNVLSLRVFTDRTVVEAYWMDGRVAMTSDVKPAMAQSGAPQVQVFATADSSISSVNAWEMGSIWVTKEQVLATPRVDGLS